VRGGKGDSEAKLGKRGKASFVERNGRVWGGEAYRKGKQKGMKKRDGRTLIRG